MSTTLHLPHKEVRPSLKRAEDGTRAPVWDLYLDDRMVAGEYTSQDEALLELDLVAWYALFGDAPLEKGKPITDEALGIALAVFNRLFTSEKVQEKARVALEKIIAPRIYTIQADGSLSVLASSGRGRQMSYAVKAYKTPRNDEDGEQSYTVTMECECKDFYARAHTHGGICKHVAARLLLFLAQLGVGHLKHLRDALDTHAADAVPTAPPEGETTAADAADERASAFLTISASHLAAALFLVARAGSAVEVRAEQGALRLVAGPINVLFPCLDGDGTAGVRLDTDMLTELYDQLRPVAKSAGALNAFLEPDGSLFVCGQDDADFAVQIHGEPLPIAATPTPEAEQALAQDAPPTPDNTTRPLTALFELFTLLEQHEPDWYLRKHHRLAHEALTAAGRLG